MVVRYSTLFAGAAAGAAVAGAETLTAKHEIVKLRRWERNDCL